MLLPPICSSHARHTHLEHSLDNSTIIVHDGFLTECISHHLISGDDVFVHKHGDEGRRGALEPPRATNRICGPYGSCPVFGIGVITKT